MIVLFTDFGLHGPYTGQMKAVLHQMAPSAPIIDLFSDAPIGNPKASAYLLASYAAWFSAGTVFLCVVDPGVGGMRPVVFSDEIIWFFDSGQHNKMSQTKFQVPIQPRARVGVSDHEAMGRCPPEGGDANFLRGNRGSQARTPCRTRRC
jgi:hypothetical protein